MMLSRFFSFSLAVAGCAAVAYAFGRHTRQLEKRELKKDLRNWEDEGGNLAPSEAQAVTPPTPAP